MTDKEAMKMALEALEFHVLGFNQVRKMELAIETLEQALAQPEQEPVALNKSMTLECPAYLHGLAQGEQAGFNGLTESETSQTMSVAGLRKPEQEPAAWVEPQLHPKDVIKLALKAGFTKDAINVWLVSMEKLIAFAAPPSKSWVSLTDEEIWENQGLDDLVWGRNIEAALRSKNT
jgi:hypothetical protein